MPQDAECFICKSSVEGKGIVRGCACRGTMGLAHLSCLVRQAQVAAEPALGSGTFLKWQACHDCGQDFHGAVLLALGWAAWRTYVDRPETNGFRRMALAALGNGLRLNGESEAALPVIEANLALTERYWSRDENAVLAAKANLASCLANVGRHEEALRLRRDVYARSSILHGSASDDALLDAANLASSLIVSQAFDEVIPFLRERILVANQAFGPDHVRALDLAAFLSEALRLNPDATRADLSESESILVNVLQRQRRVLGPAHPNTKNSEQALSFIRESLEEA